MVSLLPAFQETGVGLLFDIGSLRSFLCHHLFNIVRLYHPRVGFLRSAVGSKPRQFSLILRIFSTFIRTLPGPATIDDIRETSSAFSVNIRHLLLFFTFPAREISVPSCDTRLVFVSGLFGYAMSLFPSSVSSSLSRSF